MSSKKPQTESTFQFQAHCLNSSRLEQEWIRLLIPQNPLRPPARCCSFVLMNLQSILTVSSPMDISKLSRKKLRYPTNSHRSIYYRFFPQLLSQTYLSANPISNSFLSVAVSFPLCSLLSSSMSFLFSSETYPSSYPCKYYHGFTSLASFSSNLSSSACSKTYPFSQYKYLGFSRCSGRYNGYGITVVDFHLSKPQSRDCIVNYSTLSSLCNVSKHKEMGIVRLKPKMIEEVSMIIDMLRSHEHDLESKLSSLDVRLSISSVTVVFQILNREKLSAFRFFTWIRQCRPELRLNSDICSLAIDNCGLLDDSHAMWCLLNEFKRDNICLTKKAFGFLHIVSASKPLMMESTERMVDVLRKVGGSCYASGIYSLFEMFVNLGFYDMARFLINRTVRKISYYNILIKELCRKCDFKGVREMLEEMRKEGCDPTAQTYNYVISNLLKNVDNAAALEVFQDMLDKDCAPDELTFEIFISNSCRQGQIRTAFQFFDDMVARGLEPRHSTHAALIKGLFNSQQYEKAYEYVVGSSDKCSSNANYSLLARLHQKRGNLVAAQNILSEMIKKGLRPDISRFMIVLKRLQKSRRYELAADLKVQFWKREVAAWNLCEAGSLAHSKH